MEVDDQGNLGPQDGNKAEPSASSDDAEHGAFGQRNGEGENDDPLSGIDPRSEPEGSGLRSEEEMYAEYDALAERADRLPEADFRGARKILRHAHRLEMPRGEMASLEARIAKSTGLRAKVIDALGRDASNYITGHGYADTPQKLAKLVAAAYEREYDRVIGTEGKLFVYPRGSSRNSDQLAGPFWQSISLASVQHDLVQRYGNSPVVAGAASRKDVAERVYLLKRVEDDFFAGAQPGLNLVNGFLRLDPLTGEAALEPHHPDHRATYCLPFPYDPDADTGSLEDQLMQMMGGDEDKVVCLLQFMAATLFGVMPRLDTVRAVLILVGPSGSGKSTLVSLIKRFVPEHIQASIPPELWSDSYHLQKLQGLRLNTVTELELTGRPIKGATFKKVASHEPVTARQIRQEPVTFVPRALHIFACNQLPKLDENDRSLARRLAIISVPPMAEDTQVNPNFLEEVWAQAPAVVNLLLRAAQTMVQEGRFVLPSNNHELVTRMQFPNRPEELVARLWIEPSPGERVTSAQLQEAIRMAANDLGIDTSGWSNGTGMKPLTALLYQRYRAERHVAGGSPFYLGIRLTERARERLGLAARPGSDTGSTPDETEPDGAP